MLHMHRLMCISFEEINKMISGPSGRSNYYFLNSKQLKSCCKLIFYWKKKIAGVKLEMKSMMGKSLHA